MVRFLPMFVTGTLANVVVGLVVGRVDVAVLTGKVPYTRYSPLPKVLTKLPVAGTLFTGCATLFFALIDPDASYWAYGFPSAIFSVIGADFVFASGTLFVAKVALPHEQSLAGALFQTMTQVSIALCRIKLLSNVVRLQRSVQPLD
jgi:hypothetical protein